MGSVLAIRPDEENTDFRLNSGGQHLALSHERRGCPAGDAVRGWLR